VHLPDLPESNDDPAVQATVGEIERRGANI
jgi:hypothetical protein